ncbi:MAG: ROK family protein [Ruminococcaceae bacterium]|nr:ROK family protein [Oscillospiraceae bacterium]
MYLGIDIGGTKCAVVLGNEKGEILKKVRFETMDKERTIEKLIEVSREMGTFQSIGISCGGPLDSKKGIIMSPPNLVGWDNVPICEILNKEFSVPVYLCNDANACALAEWKFGAGRGSQNMIFLTFGTGLGAGLILDGKLYSGTNDMAGEVGHIRLDSFGPVGYGKKGSFEGFCSGGGIAQLGKTLALEKFQMGGKTGYCKDLSEIDTVTAKSIAESALEGDETARKVYEICGKQLGRGLSVLIDILNPEKIVIGSIFQRSENLLREYMEETLNEECLSLSRKVCTVVPAELGENLGDLAALSVAVCGV